MLTDLHPVSLATHPPPQALASFIVIQAALKRSRKLKRFCARSAGLAWSGFSLESAFWIIASGWLKLLVGRALPQPDDCSSTHADAALLAGATWCREDLNQRMPDYQVSMGFGLHVGE